MTYYQRQKQLNRTLELRYDSKFVVVIVDDDSPDDITPVAMRSTLKLKTWHNSASDNGAPSEYNPKVIIIQKQSSITTYSQQRRTDGNYIAFSCLFS